jgi:hypothetical protein
VFVLQNSTELGTAWLRNGAVGREVHVWIDGCIAIYKGSS